jgi:hypothetical protein
MNDLFSLFGQNPSFWQSAISLLFTAVVYFAFRHRINFLVTDFWYTFPAIGKIASLSKDTTQSSVHGWLNAERTLCTDYNKYIHLMKEPVFDQRMEYLRKTHDLGRTPTPAWVMLFLVVLVIAEGLGFSYMLGTWMAREGSANTHTLLMAAIVLVLCGIMVWVTHSAGHQFYRTSLLRGCFKRFKDEGGKSFFDKSIALKNDQSLDDHLPDYTQCANRVSARPGDLGGYGWVVIAAVSIAAIAILSTYMRWENLKGEMSRESALQTQQASSNAGNPFAGNGSPKDLVEMQRESDSKAVQDVQEATKGEGMSAFIMLGFIFVITQIVGCSAGYKYGFAGKESANAFDEVGGFSTYDAMLAHYEPLLNIAQARLQLLQQTLEQNSHLKFELTKTFMDYVEGVANDTNRFRQSGNQVHQQPRPIVTTAPATTHILDVPIQANAAPTVAEIVDQLNSMSSTEEKVSHMKKLAPELQAEVTKAVKKQKEEATAKALVAKDAELNDLFS